MYNMNNHVLYIPPLRQWCRIELITRGALIGEGGGGGGRSGGQHNMINMESYFGSSTSSVGFFEEKT